MRRAPRAADDSSCGRGSAMPVAARTSFRAARFPRERTRIARVRARSRDPRRRLRHPPVAGQPRHPAQAAGAAGRRAVPARSRPRAACSARARPSQVITVGAKAQDFLVRRELEAIDPALARHRLLEPVGRNTAAAIALAALHVRQRLGADALLWVCPSDHLMHAPDALYAALERRAAGGGGRRARDLRHHRDPAGDRLRLHPRGRAAARRRGRAAGRRASSRSPRAPAAEAMLADGGHYWNSGMFLFRADRILAELGAHAPAILRGGRGRLRGAQAKRRAAPSRCRSSATRRCRPSRSTRR